MRRDSGHKGQNCRDIFGEFIPALYGYRRKLLLFFFGLEKRPIWAVHPADIYIADIYITAVRSIACQMSIHPYYWTKLGI